MPIRKDLDRTIENILAKHEITDDNLKSAIKEIVEVISKNQTFAENIEKTNIKRSNDRHPF